MTETKKIDVLHVVRAFGDKNQSYTTNLFENLSFKGKLNHVVMSDMKISTSANIEVLSADFKKYNFYKVLYLFKCFFLNSELKQSLKGLSLKRKIRFFIKWEILIKKAPKTIHLHHLQVFDNTVLRYIKNRNIPIICSLRGRDILINSKSKKGLLELNSKLENISQIHVISTYLKNELLKIKPDSVVEVIYRGANLPMASNMHSAQESSRKAIKIIAAGRLVWEKGHIYLLDSIKRLKKSGVEIFLDIYGDGEFEEFLKFRIEQLGLNNNISLKGFVLPIELKTLYKNYDMGIQTSISEGLSNGLIDFVFHDLPVVISNVGGMVEVVENGVNGIYCDINDPLTIDNAISNCIDLDFNKLKNHNDLVRDRFSIINEINALELLYKNVSR